MSNKLAREQATRQDQTAKILLIQEENQKYMAELQKLQAKAANEAPLQSAAQVKKEQLEMREKEQEQQKELMAEMEENYKNFKRQEKTMVTKKGELSEELTEL
jgi:hypothetical protein